MLYQVSLDNVGQKAEVGRPHDRLARTFNLRQSLQRSCLAPRASKLHILYACGPVAKGTFLNRCGKLNRALERVLPSAYSNPACRLAHASFASPEKVAGIPAMRTRLITCSPDTCRPYDHHTQQSHKTAVVTDFRALVIAFFPPYRGSLFVSETETKRS